MIRPVVGTLVAATCGILLWLSSAAFVFGEFGLNLVLLWIACGTTLVAAIGFLRGRKWGRILTMVILLAAAVHTGIQAWEREEQLRSSPMHSARLPFALALMCLALFHPSVRIHEK
jgi:hypothetical protein